MLKTLLYFIFATTLLFTGCSTKTEIIKANQETAINEDTEIDEFADEFEDEEIEEKSDPLRAYNVVMTNFNDKMYINVLDPIADGYRYIVPKVVRKSVGNFFTNLMYPVRFVNNLLQGKVVNATSETGRFIINSTIGIFGLFDPAKAYFDLKPYNEDFGQTLGYWGVGSGYHIVLPFFGPSNMRDMFSMYPNSLLSPIDYHDDRVYNVAQNYDRSLGLVVYDKLNKASFKVGEYEDFTKDAVDLYPFLRDVYEQYRDKQIKE